MKALDPAFSAQPAMFMAKPPGENVSGKVREHVQWTWCDHHFMLFVAPLEESGQSMLDLLVADADPVLEVFVEHEPNDRTIIKSHCLHAMKPGAWIDDFTSYFGAFCRMRAASEATRGKFREEMEEF